MTVKIGSKIRETGTNSVFLVTDKGLTLLEHGDQKRQWSIGSNIGQPYWTPKTISSTYGFKEIEETVEAPKKTKKPLNKPLKKGERKPLFLVASRNGMTHKGLANMVNKRKIDTLGNSVTHALSKYEDRFGKKIDLDDAVVFRLVPYSVRVDKKNGRARLGSEIK